jgi:hypothetical protein
VIAAFSMQSGTLRSATTDKRGHYVIDGLAQGQYVVFKSRMDERADNIPLELMSNMRLKTIAVKQGKTSRLDIADESDDGVRVFGVVREGGAPVPRALVTMLGQDRDDLFFGKSALPHVRLQVTDSPFKRGTTRGSDQSVSSYHLAIPQAPDSILETHESHHAGDLNPECRLVLALHSSRLFKDQGIRAFGLLALEARCQSSVT